MAALHNDNNQPLLLEGINHAGGVQHFDGAQISPDTRQYYGTDISVGSHADNQSSQPMITTINSASKATKDHRLQVLTGLHDITKISNGISSTNALPLNVAHDVDTTGLAQFLHNSQSGDVVIEQAAHNVAESTVTSQSIPVHPNVNVQLIHAVVPPPGGDAAQSLCSKESVPVLMDPSHVYPPQVLHPATKHQGYVTKASLHGPKRCLTDSHQIEHCSTSRQPIDCSQSVHISEAATIPPHSNKHYMVETPIHSNNSENNAHFHGHVSPLNGMDSANNNQDAVMSNCKENTSKEHLNRYVFLILNEYC